MENRCLYLNKDHEMHILTRPIQKPAVGEVLVKIAYNSICGSDVHFFKEGKLGNFTVTEPYIPGHEASGVVETVGAGVGMFAPGDRVVIEPGLPCGHCAPCRAGRYNLCPDVIFLSAPPIDGTLQDYLVVRADALHKIPDAMPLSHAALVEPAAVAVHAVNRGRIWAGASGVIIGGGPIGLMVLQAFKASGGGRTAVVDMLEARLNAALNLGADEVYRPGNPALSERFDIAFETAGNDHATESLFDLVRPGGRAVQVGWPGSTHVPMNIASLMEREIDYCGVNRYANAYGAAIQFLSNDRIRAEAMITQRFPFTRSVEAFVFARDHAAEAIKVLIEH